MRGLFSNNESDEAFLDEVRSGIPSLPSRPAPPQLLARVLADRARGERVILPVGQDTAHGAIRRKRQLIAAVVMAAAVVPAFFAIRAGVAGDDAFVSRFAIVGDLEAHQLPQRKAPLAPPLIQTDGTKLRAGHLEFAQRWTNAAGRTWIDSRGAMDVEATTFDRSAAWRIATQWTGGVGSHGEHVEAESLYVARDDARLLRRVVHASPYNRYSRINIEQRFNGDSVTGRMTAEEKGVVTANRPIARRMPVEFAPFISEAFAPLMLSTTSLDMGWSRSVSLLGWTVRDNDLFVPVVLRVVGEESVTVPAGRFDCWRLTLEVNSRTVLYWVRKSDGIGVLTRDESKRATKGVRELVLVAER